VPDQERETIMTIRLRIRGAGTDDYGIAAVDVPASAIDWSLADAPRGRVTLADIYQVDLAVRRPCERPELATWDRD
jgi:hypothetical protein